MPDIDPNEPITITLSRVDWGRAKEAIDWYIPRLASRQAKDPTNPARKNDAGRIPMFRAISEAFQEAAKKV